MKSPNSTMINGRTPGSKPYSATYGAKLALEALKQSGASQLPPELRKHLDAVAFSATSDGHSIYFPCPFKATEAAAALKAVEASAAAAIADIRYGRRKRKIEVNIEKTAAFLFSTYIATIGCLHKGDPRVKTKLKDTDLYQAQSILYRRLSANLYETKIPGEYFHIHGSLEAGKTLNMIGLQSHRPDLTNYYECINTIESHVKQFSAAELEKMNARERQAGVTALKWEDFRHMNHGRHLLSLPPWTVSPLSHASPPVPFTPLPCSTQVASSGKPQILSGIRVLELCRIIAGPAIGRTLAEYGAQVVKVTSPSLPDVPFFQVDGNTGKHACELDLKTPSGRATFESLLATADVLIDGYRPGALEALGYGPHAVLEKLRHRDKGIVYVTEDCFGPSGDLAGRPGWQQIADCATGVAWAQGRFMGLSEPVVPPFPMSDFGTGCLGAIAALIGLFKRATEGGSWYGRTSLCQYDVFLMGLGLYPEAQQAMIRRAHDREFFELRHADSVDEVSGRALRSIRRLYPEFFVDGDRNVEGGRKGGIMQRARSRGFGGEEICWVKSAVSVEGIRVGFERASRPNGFDAPTWDGWEIEREVVDG